VAHRQHAPQRPSANDQSIPAANAWHWLVPYSASASFGPQTVAGYAGLIQVGDLSSFRTFMGQSAITDENAAPNADADNDGRTNYEEFAFGTDPDGMNTQPNFEPKSVSDGQGNQFFTVPDLRRTGGTSNGAQYSTGEVIYLPEASNDLTQLDQARERCHTARRPAHAANRLRVGAARPDFPAPIDGGQGLHPAQCLLAVSLRNQGLDHLPMLYARELLVEALELVGEAFVVEAEQVQHGCVEVADVHAGP